ncbi:DUF1538 domain-containing protein [Bacillus sp. H-16]|uniref:DUF1538 domain-containing protein n=1 Tax=Alteribacter salitolerans TaxID=2912333 RepID=UPI0019635B54|nr:DUF1538 domain-containing protein [Alteribacter salitolerans]MBM7097462.1 DUF1538 domain-containing protein [Alteribacter salitolerans]
MITHFFQGFDHILHEVALAVLPLIILFAAFQIFFLRLSLKKVWKMMFGITLTFFGLSFFLQGVGIGFFPAGQAIGEILGQNTRAWLYLPLIGLLFGFVVTFAEPAIRILNHEVEKVTAGSISSNILLFTLSIGVAVSIALSMIRIIVGIPLWMILVPGYLAAFCLIRFSKKRFITIAFDAGGVATGPMTVTFIMAIAVGVANVTEGRDPLLDGFGMISLVALTPILSVLVLGLLYSKKEDVHREDIKKPLQADHHNREKETSQ